MFGGPGKTAGKTDGYVARRFLVQLSHNARTHKMLAAVLSTASFQPSQMGGESLVMVTPPCSPTNIETAGSDVEMRSGKKKKKSVCFDSAAKAHDGICERNYIFDCLVAAYFIQQREISELDVLALAGPDVAKLSELHEDFRSLVLRIESSQEEGKSSAPILPRGGGLCMKLSGAHVPYINILDRVVEAALNRTIRNSSSGRRERIL